MRTLLKLPRFSKWPPEQAVKKELQCTSKYGQLRVSLDICHVRITDIEGFLTIYGHSDNLLNNKYVYISNSNEIGQKEKRCIAFNEFKCFQFRQVGPAIPGFLIVCTVAREDRQNWPESSIIETNAQCTMPSDERGAYPQRYSETCSRRTPLGPSLVSA